jgi:pimeloyl-ACP methyl ester carboxylesterase
MTCRPALSRFLVALAFTLALASTASAQTEAVAELASRGQKIRYLLAKPAQPAGSVILLAGGHGRLDLSASGAIGWGAGNQLVRTRAAYAKAGFVTAVPDIAPDLKDGTGVVQRYRWSQKHAQDLGALVAELRKVAAPVHLIGTSRAALSVASAAVAATGPARPDTIVITAGMLMDVVDRQPSVQKNVAGLDRITMPVFLVYHEKDPCSYTPAASAQKFKPLLTKARKVDIKLLSGGISTGEPCEARSYHGFNGIDDVVVRTVTEWIQAAAPR